MDLGWCDVCLRVANATDSVAFYQKLGFTKVDGNDLEGWAIVTLGSLRIGLFESRYMSEPFTLNFRGGDVSGAVAELELNGIQFSKNLSGSDEKGWSAEFKDPDGVLIFLDSAPNEHKPD